MTNPENRNVAGYSCPNCGAVLNFDPRQGALACPYCGSRQEIVVEGSIDECDYLSFVERGRELRPMATNALQIKCAKCMAVVTFVPPETAGVCGFCGSTLVGQPQAADPLLAPQGVLPFSVENKIAAANLQQWLASRWFAPSKLAGLARAGKLTSVYIPYWTYDAQTESYYSGQRGDDYDEVEYYEENGEQRTRSIRRTRWSGVSGEVSRAFDDHLVAATLSLSDKYLQRLEPWDLDDLRPYSPAFLAGHKAQTYQIAVEEGYGRFGAAADAVIRRDVEASIGGDHQQIDELSTTYSGVTFKHLLLPVYAGAFDFNGRIFQIVVNGRTGEVQGERPYSWIKIGLLVVAILTVLAILVLLLSLR